MQIVRSGAQFELRLLSDPATWELFVLIVVALEPVPPRRVAVGTFATYDNVATMLKRHFCPP